MKKDHTLLTKLERAKLGIWGGGTWMSSPKRLRARRRAMHTIEKLVDAQRAAKAPDPEDARILADLLAVSLRHDGSVVDHFHSRRASDLNSDAEWDEFFRLFALAHLEKWLAQRQGSPSAEPPALVVEDEYRASLEDLVALAVKFGGENQAKARDEDGAATFNLAKVSDLTAEALERIRSYLEDSDSFGHETRDGEIPADERERDIEIAALSRLKLAELEEIASERGIMLVASREGLAELIVRHSDITREQIAELALRGADLSIDTGLTTRLFRLRADPDVAVAAARLDKAGGKYQRLRLARWFVYDRPTKTDQTVVLRGRMRSYRTKPVLDVEGHKLNADPHNADVVVRVGATSRWAEVECRQLTDARDTRAVLARGAGVLVEPLLPLPLMALTDMLGTWARVTVWMLSFLQLHLEDDVIAIHNYSMAQFEASDSIQPVAPDQPRIASVQLKGQHVGSHRDACQRIVDGSRLLAVEVVLTFVPNRDQSFQIPVRIGIEDDCATIQTAAGKRIPAAASSALHGLLIDRVRRALEVDLDPSRMHDLVDKIADRARQREPTVHADMFAPQLNVRTDNSMTDIAADDDAGRASDGATEPTNRNNAKS
jgi:hypothetical protein